MSERKYSIAVGNSCEAKFWSNEEVTFDELCQKKVRTQLILDNGEFDEEEIEEFSAFEDRNNDVVTKVIDGNENSKNKVSNWIDKLKVDMDGKIEDSTENLILIYRWLRQYCIFIILRHFLLLIKGLIENFMKKKLQDLMKRIHVIFM